MADPINTKTARRRLVSYASLADLSKDLDKIESAERAGTLRHLGNHAPGSIFFHLSLPMKGSFDGIPQRAPFVARCIGRLLKKRILAHPFKPGLKLKKPLDNTLWNETISFDEGLGLLRAQIRRAAAAGAAPNASHPFFGAMSTADWQVYYLRHAELHLSFLQP